MCLCSLLKKCVQCQNYAVRRNIDSSLKLIEQLNIHLINENKCLHLRHNFALCAYRYVSCAVLFVLSILHFRLALNRITGFQGRFKRIAQITTYLKLWELSIDFPVTLTKIVQYLHLFKHSGVPVRVSVDATSFPQHHSEHHRRGNAACWWR